MTGFIQVLNFAPTKSSNIICVSCRFWEFGCWFFFAVS